MNKEIYRVTDKENTLRLDKVLTIFNKKNSRVYYSNLIKNGEVLVNGNKVSPSYKVRENDEISINYVEKEDEKDLKPLELALDVVYEDNDDIRGFISVINNDFIGALFVKKNHQGQGIGKNLIDYAKNLYDKLSLAVYKENEKALEFYKKMGFKIISENINEDTNCVEYIMKL